MDLITLYFHAVSLVLYLSESILVKMVIAQNSRFDS